ncbi:MAG: YwaF family protein [Clostridia bacterium]|nr:YwaF family protein [Clostridia bacterium]
MTIFENVLDFLQTNCEIPAHYSAFHLTMFAIMALFTVILCCWGKNCSDKAFRTIMLVCWIINVIGEIYIALMYSYSKADGIVSWNYQWYMFPFQFCSSPAYVLPFVAFLKRGKAHDGFLAFTASFSLFAGLAVMFYPGDVFMYILGVNIQTMIHHGMQASLGIFVLVHERKRLSFKWFTRGIPVFTVLVLIALGLNVWTHQLCQSLGQADLFNLYYISPYVPCTLPVLSIIYPLVPYPVFLAIYILGFTLIALLIFYLVKVIVDRVSRKSDFKRIYKIKKRYL